MRTARKERRKMLSLLAVAVLAAALGVAAYGTHLLRRSELQTIDARFSIRGTQRPPPNIILVAISVQAEQELKLHGLDARSPLPRSYDARVVDQLRRAGAKVIAMDMEFTQKSNEAEDRELFAALGRRLVVTNTAG